jgi:hypothetical protein
MEGVMRFICVAIATLAGIQSAEATASNLGNLTQPSAPGLAAAASEVGVKSMDAEVCHSFDGRFILARGFEQSTGFFIDLAEKPEPKPREGFKYEKAAGGFIVKNPVEPDMFELMAEPFEGVKVPKALWAGTFEVRFEGKVSVIDPQGKVVGDMEVSCTAARLEYN